MKTARIFGLALPSAATATQAQDAALTNALRPGWYAVPMLSDLKADQDRLTDDGAGFTLAASYRRDFAAVESNGEYLTLDRNDNTANDETRLRGGSVCPDPPLRRTARRQQHALPDRLGQPQPLKTNESAEGRARNRRGELKVLG